MRSEDTEKVRLNTDNVNLEIMLLGVYEDRNLEDGSCSPERGCELRIFFMVVGKQRILEVQEPEGDEKQVGDF